MQTNQFAGFADEAGQSLAVQIAVLKRSGWNALEARGVDGKNLCEHDDASFERVCGTLRDNGIRLIGLGSQIANWARPITTPFQKDVEELKRNMPRMLKYGAKLVRIMSYPNVPKEQGGPWNEIFWRKEVLKRIKLLAKMAEDGGVTLVHENCDGWASQRPENSLMLLEEVNSPALKLVFDGGNQSMKKQCADATWEFYEKVREQIVHVHVKASKRGPDGKQMYCYPDEDPVQVKYLGDLKRRGYRGYFSIEPHLQAIVHVGKEIEDADKAAWVWAEYARRTEKLLREA